MCVSLRSSQGEGVGLLRAPNGSVDHRPFYICRAHAPRPGRVVISQDNLAAEINRVPLLRARNFHSAYRPPSLRLPHLR